MKKIFPDGAVPINLKMSFALRETLSKVATSSGQSESAVIRAAMLCALPLFAVQPKVVVQLDAGGKFAPLSSGLLARATAIANNHGLGLDTVLAAASELGFLVLEKNPDLNWQFLESVAGGALNIPSFREFYLQSCSEIGKVVIAESKGIKSAVQGKPSKPAKKKPGK